MAGRAGEVPAGLGARESALPLAPTSLLPSGAEPPAAPSSARLTHRHWHCPRGSGQPQQPAAGAGGDKGAVAPAAPCIYRAEEGLLERQSHSFQGDESPLSGILPRGFSVRAWNFNTRASGFVPSRRGSLLAQPPAGVPVPSPGLVAAAAAKGHSTQWGGSLPTASGTLGATRAGKGARASRSSQHSAGAPTRQAARAGALRVATDVSGSPWGRSSHQCHQCSAARARGSRLRFRAHSCARTQKQVSTDGKWQVPM